MTNIRKFNDGTPIRVIRAEYSPLGNGAPGAPEPVHHIVIADRSGSMWGSMQHLQLGLTKLCSADEYKAVTSTLISYSGSGDVKTHWEEQTAPNLALINDLRPTGLTSLSGALVRAAKMVQASKGKFVVTVHSDGYVNDPSPRSERASCDRAVNEMAATGRVIVNTIAYGDYCDWSYLASLATAGGGRCLQVQNGSLKQLHDALFEGVAGLSGGKYQTVSVSPTPRAFLTLVNDPERRTVTVVDDATSVTVSPAASLVSYFESDPIIGGPDHIEGSRAVGLAALAYALKGDVRRAKDYALSAGFPAFTAHARALVSPQIAAFVAALETAVFASTYEALDPASLLPAPGATAMDVIGVASQYRSSLEVDVKALLAQYKRRGLKKIACGNPDVKVKPNDPQWASLSKFETNRASPVVNMLLTSKATMFVKGEPQPRVAGVKLDDLAQHRNYTLVADGEVTIQSLRVRTADKRAAAAFTAVGGSLDADGAWILPLEGRALDRFDDGGFECPTREDLERLIRLYAVQKVLASLTKGTSAKYDASTIEELGRFNLTPALNYSAPTKVPYEDLADAIAKGHVDTRTNYEVSWGIDEVRFMSDLPSPNVFFARRFTATGADGVAIKDPKMVPSLRTEGVTIGVKPLTGKTKLNKVDDLWFPLYDQLLGFAPFGDFLTSLCIPGPLATLSEEDAEAALAIVAKEIDLAYEGLRPGVFYTGCIGAPPESFGLKQLTPEQFTAETGVKTSPKSEAEALYYRSPDGVVLTVLASVAYFSTPAGLAAIADDAD